MTYEQCPKRYGRFESYDEMTIGPSPSAFSCVKGYVGGHPAATTCSGLNRGPPMLAFSVSKCSFDSGCRWIWESIISLCQLLSSSDGAHFSLRKRNKSQRLRNSNHIGCTRKAFTRPRGDTSTALLAILICGKFVNRSVQWRPLSASAECRARAPWQSCG
jgi:hypothetical protein